MLKNMIESLKKNTKKLLIGVYSIYTIAYILNFIIEHKVLHFIDWGFLITILFLFYISIFKATYESLFIFIVSFIIALFFKTKNFGESLKISEIYIENFFNIRSGIFIILLVSYSFTFKNKKMFIKMNNKGNEKLYEERQEDLEYIKKFIKNNDRKVNVQGIDGDFGSGKTFLMEKIVEDLKEDTNYEFIKIRCLLLGKDEVYSYISQQLDRVLKKNLIFSGHSQKLKNSLIKGVDNKFFGGISDIFVNENSLDDIENFKKTLSELSKTIVIIFDDIDRIGESEKIDKILSFISDFSGENIKIIVLYNLENLKSINEKYERRYIEKYIPIVREITPVSFSKLLRKEIKNYNLDLNEFKFLLSLEEPTHRLYEEYMEGMKENKFIEDFERLILKKMEFKIEFTPRNLKNFMEEINDYLWKKELDIENRIIIAYTFLKHVCYDNFYTKIEFNKTLESMFPIKIKLIKSDVVLSLEELDLLKNLIKQFEKIDIKYIFKKSYIKLNNKRLFLDDDVANEKNSLNAFLKKINIPKIENEDKHNEKIFYEKMYEIKKKFKEEVFEIEKEFFSNIFILSLFNYNLFYSTNEDEAIERKEGIEGAIKKLKYIGNNEYYSSYQRFYKKLCPSLMKENLDIINDDYQKLLTEYYFNDGSFESIFYFGETYEEKVMKVLNVLGTLKEEEKFLELTFKRENNKITDNYLKTFFISKIESIEISDFIIRNILEENMEIRDTITINELKKNLKRILKRINFYEYEYLNLKNDEFFEFIKDRLESKKNRDNFEYLEIVHVDEIKNIIDKYVEFINKILQLLKSNNISLREPHIDMKYNLGKSPDEIEKIKELETEEEKIKEIKKLFNEGKYKIEKLNEIYKNIKNRKE